MSTAPAAAPGDALARLRTAVADVARCVGAGPADADLVELIAGAERAKRALAAVQAEASAALGASVRAAEAAAGVPAARRGRSVGPQVALARGVSQHLGGRHAGAARALVEELPETLRALRSGSIEEWTATKVVQATACLGREDRARVDRGLAAVFARPGVGAATVIGSARALAQQADPAAAVARARKAATERCVSLRPAPDTMTYLTALLPVAEGVAVHAALLTAVREHAATRAPGDDRGRGQVMADTLVERVTGRDPHTEAVPVVVHLVMDTDTLLAAGTASASVPGHGPVPARIARELLATATEAGQAWVRRSFTAPDDHRLVGLDSSARVFPAGLAAFLRARDQRCATPHCDAPIRHLDHVEPHARGGATSAVNGQGLCEACNHTKELPGFSATRDPVTGVTALRTPTGHAYGSSPPPVLGHPLLPDELDPTRVWLRRVLGTAA
ncbi:DUF222 domain-containing protein [Kineococcus siccus]|uniref:DUF222 domain-containing protein n=1 Tax=Kineococcus siccus TaxID=2696567 RepID=UPI00196AD27A